MDFLVQPGGTLDGELKVPGDKSISHRAVMLGSIANGSTEVDGLLDGEDVRATVAAFRAMGVSIRGPVDGHLVINGAGLYGLRRPEHPLDMGNSGTAMRLMTGLLAPQPFESELHGDESLSQRPMKRVVDPLVSMGASIDSSDDGTPPLKIRPVPRLDGIEYELPVASAQIKSALLLAGLYAAGDTCVIEPAPSRDHTERMLRGFGVSPMVQGNRRSVHGGQELTGCHLNVASDISSATFFLVGASIAPGSRIFLPGVGINPTRTGILQILKKMGANIGKANECEQGGEPVADLEVQGSTLDGIEVPEDWVPLAIDEFPAVAIAAACASGSTRVTGAAELRVKESDRIAAVVTGLNDIGIQARELPDGFIIEGGKIDGGTVDSRGDHRIAMAFAMAGLRARREIRIQNCANVATSYPGFIKDAESLGLSIEVIP